jgi:hypothetical protein
MTEGPQGLTAIAVGPGLGLSYTVDPFDRDHVVVDHIHDPVRADAETAVPAAVKSFRRLRVTGQKADRFAECPHAGLVVHEPARR